MTDTIRLVDYYYIQATDKPGEGARLLRHLKDAGVNLAVLHAFPRGRRTQVDFVPTSGATLKAAARSAKWKIVGPKKAFVIEGDDRVGALAEYFAMLGDARINVTAVSAVTAGAGRFGAILWVDPRNVKRTAKLLGAG
ncbi:MAG TPA: hypothetical protein VEZ44_02995 [bacterium]|nr:hypothetical protein [bacterium]